MTKFVLTRRGFLTGATAGGVALIASSYVKRDAWAAQESAQETPGVKIQDSESALHGADSSKFNVVDTYSFPGFRVVQIALPVLSVFTYLVISEGEALLIDPVRDITFYLETAKKKGAKIVGVYLSHSHADFVAGHTEVKKALGVPIYQSHKSGAKYAFKATDEKFTLKLGKAVLKFMDTPGHTLDGQCCGVYSEDDLKNPKLLFTGDVLFVGSVGRPDLMDGTVSAAWLASAFYDTWMNKLSKLPDNVVIFPAHGAGSLCGANLGNDPKSTIGREKGSNPYFKARGKGEFIAMALQGLPEAPQYFKHNAKMNREGPAPVDWNAPAPREIRPTSELMKPSKYYLVDLRESDIYTRGHIPNSVNIAARGRMETWVGSIVPWGSRLVLIGDPDLLKEARHRLHRIGYKGDALTLDTWQKGKLPIKSLDPISPQKLYDLMQKGEAPLIVDVRLPTEWMALRIGNVLNLPLTHLAELSSKLEPDEPVTLVCNSAYRSSMATGILERKGFTKAISLAGGSQAWIDAGLPVFEGQKSPG
ncbi:MAG: rhodanese-like domain-containing protein [Deltaproteobacteria bacterium]|nr:rhodanese-like domain-containing protein [Deltaproteobacteria bacterium]